MKDKVYFIVRLICTSFVMIFLFNMFIKTTYFSSRIIILPFLICSFTELLKIIMLLFDKYKLANIFNKIYTIAFLLYWFGFLSYFCYISFISKSYLLLIFSIPFWMIGVYVVRKHFFKIKRKDKKEKVQSKFNFKVIVSGLLVGICLLSGVAMLFLGIKDTYKLNKKTRGYITTTGYFSNYEIYKSDEDGTTYKLTFTYKVKGKEYTVKTDYGTNYIPKENSIRKVKYNASNPKEAILVGTNSKNALIYMGTFFTLGSTVFILAAFTMLGYFDKFKIDVMGVYISLVFLIVGIGIILFQNGTTGSFMETIKSFGLWILIPFMFIVIGLFQTIKCLFFNQKKNKISISRSR